MLRNLRARIAVAYGALMVACVGAFTVYLVGVSQESYLGTLQQGVGAQAKLVGVAAQPYLAGAATASEIDRLAKRLGVDAGVRVTIIDKEGVVLADSEHDPLAMENHGTRPEVIAALESGRGESRRRSATAGYDTMYVATPIMNGQDVLGVARVAVPIARINQAAQEIAWAIVLGGLAATALAVGLAILIASSVTRPVERLTAMAGLMAEGKLDQRIGSYSGDEVGRLGAAFDLMAERLRDTIAAISAEKNTLSTILSTMADGIVIVDEGGRVNLVNRAAAAMLQMQVPYSDGRSYVEVLRDHELSDIVRRCLAEGTQQSGIAEIGRPRRILRMVAAPLRRGRAGALALLQDLTEVRRAETIRREFVANVSHELRTPIATLKALVETLEEGAIGEPEVARDFLEKMHTEVDGLAQLVSELLELSRIESGQAKLRVEPAEVGVLVRGAAGRLKAQAERAGLELAVEVPDGLPRVTADVQRIGQVLTNLIHNAVKFTPPGGRITVLARKEGEQVAVSVSDTGIGISTEHLPRIFERFYKADPSRSEGGTGLGLAVAKHVVQAHGGEIRAESAEGQGSTFTFTLPVEQRGPYTGPDGTSRG